MLSPTTDSEVFTTSKFIDFDKDRKIFYNNLYIDDFKIVIKMPCVSPEKDIDQNLIKIEKFDLVKYTYLLSYE
ncbi:MAG: hypothetical protein ACFFDO_07000 [Candidatus Thorarchaeota archaeon]